MALTAEGAPVTLPLPLAGINSEVAEEVSCEEDVFEAVVEAAEVGLANLAQAFFHLHCVHHRSRCSNP